jgi:hypothetical protein
LGVLNKAEAEVTAHELLEIGRAEHAELERLHAYFRGIQPLPVIPTGVPNEVVDMAQMSRINLCKLAVDVPAQSMFVDGFRDPTTLDNDPTWSVWQANKMDAHQSAIYRAAFTYKVSYLKVVPGDEMPVMRGLSPRNCTAVYDESDPDWPVYALETVKRYAGLEWRLYDEDAIYFFVNDAEKAKERNKPVWPVLVAEQPHGAGVCPIVRFRNCDDLDGEGWSEIEPLMPLQDQMDLTTFDLLVAQHFAAFRQRYIMGWTADSETERIKASAARMMLFDDPDVKVGEFSQTDLGGYLDSRQKLMEQFGVVSQVPPHNLLGQMVNLSAEALVAAEVGHSRKMNQIETLFGEAVEQALRLAGTYIGVVVSDEAQVRWRDTEARSFAATVDGLGKLAEMLNVPVELLWAKIPGFTQQDVQEARELVRSGDPIQQLIDDIDRQMASDDSSDAEDVADV